MTLPSRADSHFKLRIPPELRKRIADAASDNARSSNAEVVSRLSHSFRDDDRLERIEMKMDMLLHLYPMLSGGEPDAGFLDVAGNKVANPDAAWDAPEEVEP